MMTTLWSGLSVGSLYALVAIGYTLTYLGAAVFNFAQAALLMVGVYVAYWGLSSVGLPTVAVAVFAAGIVALIAVVEERIAIRRVRSHEALLITTVAFATIIDGVTQRAAGSQPHLVPFFGSSVPLQLLGGRVLPVELILIVTVVVLGVGFFLLSRRTLLGIAGLAVSADREAAMLYGISPRPYSTGSFVLAGALVGFLSIIIGPKTLAYSTLDSSLALKGFVALAFGGFGSIEGATVGGFLTGVIEAFLARYAGANYQDVGLFVFLLATLLLFPGGVFQGRQRTRLV